MSPPCAKVRRLAAVRAAFPAALTITGMISPVRALADATTLPPLVLPSIGVAWRLDDPSPGPSRELHAGLLVGKRFDSDLSANGEITVGWRELCLSNCGQFSSYTEVDLDLSLSPLIHFPFEMVEVVAGAKLGFTVGYYPDYPAERWWGVMAGLNGGVFSPRGSAFSVGALGTFEVERPLDNPCLPYSFDLNCRTIFKFTTSGALMF